MAIDTSIPMMGIRGLYGQTPNLMQGFQQGRQFIGNAQLGQAMREGGDIARTLAGFDPMAGLSYQNRMMEANKSSSGITGNMRVKMQQEAEDAPIRTEIGKLKGDIIRYVSKNPDAGVTDPAIASKVARMEELNYSLNDPIASRNLKDMIRDAMNQKRFEQSERAQKFKEDKFLDQQEDEAFDYAQRSIKDALKVAVGAPVQLARVKSLLRQASKGNISAAEAANKMLIQSLDNSVVMGKEAESLMNQSVESKIRRFLDQVQTGNRYTPTDLNNLWGTADTIAKSTREAMQALASKANKAYLSRLKKDMGEDAKGDLQMFKDYINIYAVPDFGAPPKFRELKSESSGTARGGSGEIELTPRPR